MHDYRVVPATKKTSPSPATKSDSLLLPTLECITTRTQNKYAARIQPGLDHLIRHNFNFHPFQTKHHEHSDQPQQKSSTKIKDPVPSLFVLSFAFSPDFCQPHVTPTPRQGAVLGWNKTGLGGNDFPMCLTIATKLTGPRFSPKYCGCPLILPHRVSYALHSMATVALVLKSIA